MVRSPGFGSINSDKRSFQARFHCGYSIHCLNPPLPISRRLILQQARSQRFSRPPTACKFMVSCSFHSPPGVLFTFPSRYFSLSVIQEYLALRGGPRGFTRDFTCPMLLGNHLHRRFFQLLDYHHLGYRIHLFRFITFFHLLE